MVGVNAPHILIVDDEENHRRSLAIGLRLEGFVVSEARDGEHALEWLEHNCPDIAIVDLMMPGINGLDLARRMRMRHPDVRVVLTSAYHLTERQIERAAVGAIGFVPKPYSMDELAGFLRAKLARRSSIPAV
ncbi:response regulator transcription factor [Sandaracinus amylolyticus]|uniref:response regulator transcription factor n=1 Tax=Sandaracinus amylolyticus TaxID=927083 RepID=UPI001F3704FA|nr:response regulator [Sandaracinus amylolyticus]UJR80951.1 Phosphate regulon transcriptional regulatory protein PhoB [Sandaracinus amylolyticus]